MKDISDYIHFGCRTSSEELRGKILIHSNPVNCTELGVEPLVSFWMSSKQLWMVLNVYSFIPIGSSSIHMTHA